MSPTGVDGDDRADDEAVGQRDRGAADAALHRAARAPPILPTVAPAPAPTLPSATGAALAAAAAPVAAVGRRPDRRVAADAEVEQDRAGTIGTLPAAGRPADAVAPRATASRRSRRRGRTRCRRTARWR